MLSGGFQQPESAWSTPTRVVVGREAANDDDQQRSPRARGVVRLPLGRFPTELYCRGA